MIAAALLAVVSGGPPLVLPHARSIQVLSEIRRKTEFMYAVVDGDTELPNGVKPLRPGSGSIAAHHPLCENKVDLEKELLQLTDIPSIPVPTILLL